MKTHKFIVTVKTARTKAMAKAAILCAFGKRMPDACEFHLTEFRKPKPEVRVVYVDPERLS